MNQDSQICFHTWVRVSWDEGNIDIIVPSLEGGWWTIGPPFQLGIWSLNKPEGQLHHLGELWMDDYLRPYLRGWSEDNSHGKRVRRWYRLDDEIDLALCLPPLPSAYPPLPPRPRYPECINL